MDTQQIEIIGKNLLVSACVSDGLEVAEPIRDKGIDLVVFDDVDGFRAYPVQLKAGANKHFSIDQKYVKFTNMLMAYTWKSADPIEAELYVMRYEDAVDIAQQMGWTTTNSWVDGGYYTSNNPSEKLLRLVAPYKYSRGYMRRLFNKMN